jgi:hypothetical protein
MEQKFTASFIDAIKFGAPMKKLRVQGDDPGTRVRRGLEALTHLYNPHPAPIVSNDRFALYDTVAQTIGNAPLTYLEFGVYRGNSIAKMAQKFTHPSSRFFGFDSFQGLPEKWDANNDIGMFDTNGAVPRATDDRVTFISGYFQDTVRGFLDTHELSDHLLVHFDADLYSSTLFLLTTLASYRNEYFFLFDEFFPDEVNALRDFACAFPIDISFDAAVINEQAKRPVQVFGRLKRVPLTLDL